MFGALAKLTANHQSSLKLSPHAHEREIFQIDVTHLFRGIIFARGEQQVMIDAHLIKANIYVTGRLS